MKIQEQVNLKPYNSFQLECIADYFCVVESISDFIQLSKSEIYKNQARLILGWWSNILLTKPNYPWLVIKNEIMGKNINEETEESITVQLWAWENRDNVVQRSLENNLHGIENLISIPGSVGAAPMQNIWAYGCEVKDVIINVQWIDLPSGSEVILANYECDFRYRESIFKHELKDNFFITHVTIKLHKYIPSTYFPKIHYWAIQEKLQEAYGQDALDVQITPKIVADTIAQIRESKLPDRKKLGTAGSFFKNPIVSKEKFKKLTSISPEISWYESGDQIKINAWQLIDLAWLKWLQHGNVGTYHKHALVLVNNGGWTWEELLELAARIQKIVKETYDVEIVPEVNYVD